jgi:pectate lyase
VIGTAVGYGREATGGLGGDVCWVESLDDDGAGTLRDCATRDTPTWVRFRVSGNIDLRTLIDVSSNTTIDGRGAEITIRNRGLRLNRVRNVVLLYLKFDDGGGDNEDALQILNETEHVWVDHVTLEDFTDGLLDITRGSRFVTVSWCHFRDHDKTMLIGANPDHEDDRRIRVTVHHSWFERTNQRHPRLRCGKVHIFNTYYDRWGLYVMGSSLRGQIRSQRNVFEAERSTEATKVIVGDDPDDGDLRSDNDERRNGARIVERDPEDVFDPRDDYPYELEDAGDALVDRIRTGAGWRQVPLP